MHNPEMQPFESMLPDDGADISEVARLARSYEHQANHLRLRFFDVFSATFDDFSSQRSSWIVYEVPEIERDTPTGIFANRYIALMAYIPVSAPDDVEALTLRIISNDHYAASNGKKQVMSEDFMLDQANKAQYGIRTSTIRIRDMNANNIPLFRLDDENKIFINCLPDSVEVGKVKIRGDGLPPIYPYGNYANLEDRTSMLYLGHDLLSEVAQRTPLAYGRQ